jgi:hypothetical protein
LKMIAGKTPGQCSMHKEALWIRFHYLGTMFLTILGYGERSPVVVTGLREVWMAQPSTKKPTQPW